MGKFRRSWQQGFNAGVEQQRKAWRLWFDELEPEIQDLIAEREGARRQRMAWRYGVRYPGATTSDCTFLWS
jgi:hypothetical protein